MGLLQLPKGEKIHSRGTAVSTLEVLISGTVKATDGTHEITFGQGNIIGAVEMPGMLYAFDYIAVTEVKAASYPYEEKADIERLIHANEKIAPILANATVNTALSIYEVYASIRTEAVNAYQRVMSDYADYPALASSLGEQPETFSSLLTLEEPPEPVMLSDWMTDFFLGIRMHGDFFTKQVYGLEPELAAGFTMWAVRYMEEMAKEKERLKKYVLSLKNEVRDFYGAFGKLEKKRQALHGEETAEEDDTQLPDFSDALSHILSYAGLSYEDAEGFTELFRQYQAFPDRTDMTDALRRLRREIGEKFFDIYAGAFLHAMKAPEEELLPEVRMFLMFGFMDEALAGEENTEALFRIMRSYRPDPTGVVKTIPEWLSMIYRGEVMPSKNEFDLDYPAYLRECRQNGEITAAREAERLNNMAERVKFEIDNLFKVADRMTFGRVTSFIPVFDSCNVTKAPDRAFLSAGLLHEKLDFVRGIDFSCFYHPKEYSNERIELSHFPIHEEVLPYMILLPNMGSRIALWQEIEGKKRDTPARFVLPLFTAEDPTKSLLAACGEYRWEMCKTEQGVHWNDITDPSLTAEYADYIQYYRKNRALTQEQKEKLKKTLQKVSNNLRRAFTIDYVTYLSSEANGAPVMNKAVRGILFSYIPFSEPIREKISQNPQYAEYLNKYRTKAENQKRPLENVIRRLEAHGEKVPKELLSERRFLSM